MKDLLNMYKPQDKINKILTTELFNLYIVSKFFGYADINMYY